MRSSLAHTLRRLIPFDGNLDAYGQRIVGEPAQIQWVRNHPGHPASMRNRRCHHPSSVYAEEATVQRGKSASDHPWPGNLPVPGAPVRVTGCGSATHLYRSHADHQARRRSASRHAQDSGQARRISPDSKRSATKWPDRTLPNPTHSRTPEGQDVHVRHQESTRLSKCLALRHARVYIWPQSAVSKNKSVGYAASLNRHT